ncbi:MAG TPA: TadE family protein [Candidatus Binataceae bacterium]|nr:TadE family protein [Candidatus Binataceae bacterium]
MVELAMALPLLILMLVAAVDIGRLLFIAITANSAARAGVQYGAQSVITASDTTEPPLPRRCLSTRGPLDAALQDGKDVSGLSATATYYCKCPDASTPPKCGDNVCASGDQIIYVNVIATAQFTPMTKIPGIPSPLTITTNATRRVAMQ